MSPTRLRTLAPIAVLAAAFALLACGSTKSATTVSTTVAFAGSTLSPPAAAPQLNTLRNYDGTPFDLAAQRGKAVFVTFLYTHCPDTCPLIASNLHNAYAKLSPAQRSRVAIVAVSTDPRGDTPATVSRFMRQHQLAGEGVYLIGSASALRQVWKAWSVSSEANPSNPEQVSHSALIYGIGASGHMYTIYPGNFVPDQIVHDVTPLLAR